MLPFERAVLSVRDGLLLDIMLALVSAGALRLL